MPTCDILQFSLPFPYSLAAINVHFSASSSKVLFCSSLDFLLNLEKFYSLPELFLILIPFCSTGVLRCPSHTSSQPLNKVCTIITILGNETGKQDH